MVRDYSRLSAPQKMPKRGNLKIKNGHVSAPSLENEKIPRGGGGAKQRKVRASAPGAPKGVNTVFVQIEILTQEYFRKILFPKFPNLFSAKFTCFEELNSLQSKHCKIILNINQIQYLKLVQTISAQTIISYHIILKDKHIISITSISSIQTKKTTSLLDLNIA
eukprot:TRINITY_DN1630_c0_g1_i11.p1 TRINITY_DN1630_c0_g1~~TRINITY_DN1630_c0_g1_i11.p1  ORF type:complete len:164 (+),score=4.36 TRINITY_DN1630_c0_g1_i11:1-492(+)